MTSRSTRRRALGLAVFAAGAALLTPRAAPSRQAQAPLQAQAEAIVGRSEGWTVMAWSMDRRRPLFSINADQPHVPASNNKVYSAIWALEMLGPDYRFPTDLLLPGPVPQDGVVRGDLYLRGSGDPAYGYPEFDKDPMNPIRILARQLKARGVKAVTGGVVGDPSVFDTLFYGPEWPADTGNGAAYYAPTVNGLAFQRNILWVNATPGPGGRAAFAREPDVPEIPVVSLASNRGGRGWAVRKPGQDTIQIKGGIIAGRPNRYPVGVADASLLAPAALRQALREEGIQVQGPVRRGKTPDGAKLVHRHYSITLAEMLPKLNRDSDNFFAEHVWKAASARSIGVGSYERGPAASAKFFEEKARTPRGQIHQADGSGLSAQNKTSALAMVTALAYADRRPWSRALHESMALAGDRNGTLRRLFNGGAAEGNLHAKTGYIRGVRSLSGYVKTKSGENVAFSFIYNGRNTGGARGVQQQLGELLASYAGP